MRQSPLQSAAEFLRQLRRQVMPYDYDSTLDTMLSDQLVVGIHREDIRRSLLADANLTLQRVLEIISVEEQVDKNATYFHQLHEASSKTRPKDHVQLEDSNQRTLVRSRWLK